MQKSHLICFKDFQLSVVYMVFHIFKNFKIVLYSTWVSLPPQGVFRWDCFTNCPDGYTIRRRKSYHYQYIFCCFKRRAIPWPSGLSDESPFGIELRLFLLFLFKILINLHNYLLQDFHVEKQSLLVSPPSCS